MDRAHSITKMVANIKGSGSTARWMDTASCTTSQISSHMKENGKTAISQAMESSTTNTHTSIQGTPTCHSIVQILMNYRNSSGSNMMDSLWRIGSMGGAYSICVMGIDFRAILRMISWRGQACII